MIKHIVMLKLKEFDNENIKLQNANKLKSLLESLEKKIKEIKYYEVGLNFSKSPSAFDLVLISEFENAETLEIYSKHSEHKKVLDFLNEISKEKAVVDFTF